MGRYANQEVFTFSKEIEENQQRSQYIDYN